jgi:type I restriction enzyme M protein
MLSNPPYGKSWKTDLDRMGGKDGIKDARFLIEHGGDPEYSLVTRSSDGQMLFLANLVSKMKHSTKLGSRIAEVHNGSSLFTGDAGQGESNIRRWIIENDWLEAIVALPLNMFYNTGIATYIWVITNKKAERRKGKVQLINAIDWYKPLRKNLGKKNCELSVEDIDRIVRTFLDFKETEQSKIFENEAFGYYRVTVERPLRIARIDADRAYMPKEIKALKEARGADETAPAVIRKIHKQAKPHCAVCLKRQLGAIDALSNANRILICATLNKFHLWKMAEWRRSSGGKSCPTREMRGSTRARHGLHPVPKTPS